MHRWLLPRTQLQLGRPIEWRESDSPAAHLVVSRLRASRIVHRCTNRRCAVRIRVCQWHAPSKFGKHCVPRSTGALTDRRTRCSMEAVRRGCGIWRRSRGGRKVSHGLFVGSHPVTKSRFHESMTTMSVSSISKKSTFRFSVIRDGLVDFGIVTYPRCRHQRIRS